MAFRADEAAAQAYEEVLNYLVPRDLDQAQRIQSRDALAEIAISLGPVVHHYPCWHPLVVNHSDANPVTVPCAESGYRGLDHTRYFANGFITCPYSDGQEVINSVDELPPTDLAIIRAERLNTKFYHPDATAILVKCTWGKALSPEGKIPLSLAVPLILEREIPSWRHSQVAETWESMRPYFIGAPHGSLSSHFVDKETGQGIKKMWNGLISTGMFGPVRV